WLPVSERPARQPPRVRTATRRPSGGWTINRMGPERPVADLVARDVANRVRVTDVSLDMAEDVHDLLHVPRHERLAAARFRDLSEHPRIAVPFDRTTRSVPVEKSGRDDCATSPAPVNTSAHTVTGNGYFRDMAPRQRSGAM